MNQLTYADRELLLETFDAFTREGETEDDDLLTAAADWAKRFEPGSGLERNLGRNVVCLSRYLSQQRDRQDVADIARSALRYLLLAADRQPTSLARFDLLDDAFIAAYAVQGIRGCLDEPSLYNPPRLTSDEQRRAESPFLELAAAPIIDRAQRVMRTRAIKGELGSLGARILGQSRSKS